MEASSVQYSEASKLILFLKTLEKVQLLPARMWLLVLFNWVRVWQQEWTLKVLNKLIIQHLDYF